MLQEVGHKTSKGRRPSLAPSGLLGAIAPPAELVMSSDKVNSPRDWMVHRASVIAGVDMPGSRETRFSRSTQGGTRTSPFSKSERRRLAGAATVQQNAQRELGWDPSPNRCARAAAPC